MPKRKPKSPWFSAEKTGYWLQIQEVPAFFSCPQLKLESIYSQHSRGLPIKSLYRVLADFYPFPTPPQTVLSFRRPWRTRRQGSPPTPSPAHAGELENLVLQKSRGRRLRVVCGWGHSHVNAPPPCRATEHIPASTAGCLQEQQTFGSGGHIESSKPGRELKISQEKRLTGATVMSGPSPTMWLPVTTTTTHTHTHTHTHTPLFSESQTKAIRLSPPSSSGPDPTALLPRRSGFSFYTVLPTGFSPDSAWTVRSA